MQANMIYALRQCAIYHWGESQPQLQCTAVKWTFGSDILINSVSILIKTTYWYYLNKMWVALVSVTLLGCWRWFPEHCHSVAKMFGVVLLLKLCWVIAWWPMSKQPTLNFYDLLVSRYNLFSLKDCFTCLLYPCRNHNLVTLYSRVWG